MASALDTGQSIQATQYQLPLHKKKNSQNVVEFLTITRTLWKYFFSVRIVEKCWFPVHKTIWYPENHINLLSSASGFNRQHDDYSDGFADTSY